MLLRNVIGAVLRRIRQDEGLTLREVALTANISMPYLSEIERGRKEPSSEILAGICAALGLTVVDLLHEAAVEGRRSEGLLVDLTAPVAPVTAIRSVHERVEARAPSASPARDSEIALAAA
jgi:transcriptional regulator with XRE-family HTH domain